MRAIVEDLQRKALSPDPDIDPHSPFPWAQDVPPTPQPNTTIIAGRLTQDVLDEALQRNPNYKAPGPDGIPGVILNNMPTAFLKATLALFQLMAVTGITPPAWLKTHTVLLYKKNDPLCVDNYRPIALAPILYTLRASCLTILTSRYVETNKILSPEQEGFRSRRSTARAIMHLLLAIEDAHTHDEDILLCYLDFKGAYPSTDHFQLTRVLEFLGLPRDFCRIVSNLYRDASTAFLTPYGPTIDIAVLRGTLQGDPLSPLLFDLMMEPLIRWLTSKKKGYQFGSTGLTLASKWYADDATLLANSAPNMISQLHIVDSFSSWSGIRINVPKCCITAFIQQLQSIPRKTDRDNALRGRLAHIKISGQLIKTVSQDEPLPGGYLGTALTASLNPQAQLTWIKSVLNDICHAVTRAPLPPRVRQQLLLYGAHSKVMHTHCLLALSPAAITQLDSILESACRRIWKLPKCFPRTALHAPHHEWGLNLPTLWEDYCASGTRTWSTILNDQGALGLTARTSLQEAATNYAQWPLELVFSLNKRGTPMCTSLSAKCMAAIIMGDLHPLGGPPMWEGNPISRSLVEAVPISLDADGSPLPNQPFLRIDAILRQLTPLWTNNISSWAQLARLDLGGRPYLLPEDELQWANPHLNPTSLTATRRPIIYLHRLMASTSLEDMARICSQTPPKQVLRGHFAPRWRSLLQTTLSSLPAAPSPLELAQVLNNLVFGPSSRLLDRQRPPGADPHPIRSPASMPQ